MPAPKLSTKAWTVLLTTYAAYVAVYAARKPFSVVKAGIAQTMGYSTLQLATVDTALLLAYAVGQLSLGYLARPLGRRLTLVLGFFVAGLATAAMSLAQTPAQMALFWGVAGLAAAPTNPLFLIIVGDVVPDGVRSTVLGVWTSCENVGGVFANLLASSLLKSYGWRTVFLVCAPVIAIWAPVLLAVLPSDASSRAPSKASKAAAEATATKGSSNNKPPSSVSSIPGVAAVATCYTLTKCARYCLMFWLPYFLSTYVLLSPAAAGSVAALFDLAGALGAMLMGIAVDNFYGGKMLRAAQHSLAATGVSFGLWALLCHLTPRGVPPSAGAHVAALLAVGFFVAGPGGVCSSSSRNLVEYAGRAADGALIAAASGLVNGAGSLGAVIQGMLAPHLLALVGWSGLFGILALSMVLASLGLLPAIAIEKRGLDAKKKQ